MRKQYVLSALCATSLASTACAQSVTVTVRAGANVEHTEVLDPGEAWMHSITNSTTRINIEPSASTVDIGRLTFNGGNRQNVDVILGSGTGLGSGVNPTSVGDDWAGFVSGGSANFRLYGGITGNLTGSILVEQLDRFDADGAIQALVQADDPYSTFFLVFADSVSSAGSIDCVNGGIDEINITNDCNGTIDAHANFKIKDIVIGGDLLADVTAGYIGSIAVTGDIGTSGTLVSITTSKHLGEPSPSVNHSIENISAYAIYADITTPHTNNATDRGDMGTLTTTSGDSVGSLTTFAMQGENHDPSIDIAGHLYADIEAETIKRSIEITGDLKSGATLTMKNGSKPEGDILIVGALAGTIDFPAEGTSPVYDADIEVGSIASTGKILVGDDMKGSIDCGGTMAGFINIDGDLDKLNSRGGVQGIEVATTGLTGQIIINSADGGGSWTDNVKVGATILSPKGSYTQTGLGGGAVGLVGFSCHLQDCIPPYSGSTSPTLSAPFKVTLRHYGPVIWDIDESPIKVLFCDGPTCDTHIDVSSDFEVTSTPNGLRHVVLEPKGGITPAVGHYHISPKTELNCDDTTANRPDVDNYTYNVEYLG